MKAIIATADRLVWGDADEPELGPGEVRLINYATAVNRADLLQRRGGYPPPPGASPILGLECAGVVAKVGEGVTRVAPGDAVCALLAGGGYAETVVVPAGQVLHKPKRLSFAEAAAVPEVFATAYLNLLDEAGLAKGERAVVHAGASGVGTAAIALCRAFGSQVFVTAGSDEKIERCRALGADAGWNRHRGSFLEPLVAWSEGRGADVILDPVGASYFADNLAGLAVDGRLVLIGLLGGTNAQLPLAQVLTRRLRVVGSTLRSRSIAAKAAVMDALAARVWPLLESGAIAPAIETVMPIAEAEAAHALIATNDTFGKVVLAIRDADGA